MCDVRGTMEVTRAGLVAVLLALLASAQHIDEDRLQSIDASNVKGILSNNDNLSGAAKGVLNVHSTLREFKDHAEMKMKLDDLPKVQEETTLRADREEEQDITTTEAPEPLPTPLPIKNEAGTDGDMSESNIEDLMLKTGNKTSSIVPRKEAIYKKPSVVPKKGVGEEKPLSLPNTSDKPDTFTPSVFPRKESIYKKPSVVPKKGVGEEKPLSLPNTSDKPDTFTPSVFPRKGADPGKQKSSSSARTETDPNSLLLDNYKINSNDTSNKGSPGQNVLALQSVSKNIAKSRGKFKDYLGDKEVHVKQSDSFFSQSSSPINDHSDELSIMPGNTTKLSNSALWPVMLNTSTAITVPANLENLKNGNHKNESAEVHSKPSVATDDLDAANADPDSNNVNFGVVVLGLSLFVALAVAVVLIYRKVKDIWMRRHYAHVNFLVDGMYDM